MTVMAAHPVRRKPEAGQRGQALAEFALVVALMVLMALAVFDIGRGFHAYLAVIQGARDGARVAMDAARSDDDIIAAARSAAAPLSPAVSVVRSGSTVTVTVTYAYQPITPLAGLALGGTTLTVSSSMVSY